jgi:WD40-like Beta Propeller Repeat
MLMRLRVVLLGLVGVLVLGVPGVALAAEGQVCPNEALRQELGSGFLPDCRAYEMVSPVYKEGYEFQPGSFASDGSRAFVYSDGAVAGIENEGEGTFQSAVYMDTRTATGWQLEPVTAPLGEFVSPLPFAFEADSGLSLWMQHTPAESARTKNLYVRSAGGVYSLIGPLVKPELSTGEPSNVMENEEGNFGLEPVAATGDYSHVLMRTEPNKTQAVKWPFDGTVGPVNSLYEYSGTGNHEPILVGVTGPHGSTNLVGECGTELGSGNSGSAYNALSSDGETVFFTPNYKGNCGPTDVWARRHGGLHASLPAETVDVSVRAPEPACAGACRSSAESGKHFEGASEDGERVFFTSTQQLLNGASQDPVASDDASVLHGGGEGCAVTTGVGGCNLYEYDFAAPAGENLRLVAGGAEVLGVARIAEDGSRVYFVARGVLAASGNEFGAKPVGGEPNLYVYDAEEAERDPGYKPVFVVTLGSSDSEDWATADGRPVVATPDGRFLVFVSSRPGLTPGDTAVTEQMFEYDARTGELVRVSQGEDGYNDNGNDAAAGVIEGPADAPRFFETNNNGGRSFRSSTDESNVADNGMTVVFESVGRFSALALSAEHGCRNVYEYRSGQSIADGAVHLISGGLDMQLGKGGSCPGAGFRGMDAEGENILFQTKQSLLPGDTDGVQPDIYDARVGGGFALPSVSVVCQGEGCLGVPAAPPALAGAGSTVAAGGGNLSQVVPSVVVKTRVKPLTRAEMLARALRVCRRESRRRRGVCEVRARRRYAVVSRASRANGRGR